MHIRDIFTQDRTTLSFEFFPPKGEADANILFDNISELEELHPSFVSVTYGAGGSTRQLTHDLVARINQTTKLAAVPHLTCVCHQTEEVEEILANYAKIGVSNILALGGDPPRGLAGYRKEDDSFQHAGCKRSCEDAGAFLCRRAKF